MLELPDKIRFTKCGENTMLKTFARAMLFALVATGNAGAAAYPERSITVVVAFAAGGATDISTRVVGMFGC